MNDFDAAGSTLFLKSNGAPRLADNTIYLLVNEPISRDFQRKVM